MRNAIALALMLSVFAAHKRFWRTSGAEQQFVIVGMLGGEHDRVCGVIAPSPTNPGGYWFSTMRAGGAKVGLSGDVSSFHQAQAVVEEDCR
jgi:hypothetical protein